MEVGMGSGGSGMPRMYRSMTPDPSGQAPQPGRGARLLGVRVPPVENPDVQPDAAGNVHPLGGGMSVCREWRQLMPHRIPRRLQGLRRGASGRSEDKIWRLGDGAFASASIDSALSLRVDHAPHGSVEPSRRMGLADYEAALAATAPKWVIDES